MDTIRVCVISPIHKQNDIRIFHKQIPALLENGYSVDHIAKEAIGSINIYEENYRFLKMKVYKKFNRIVSNFWLIRKTLQLNADIYHLHNPDTLIIGFILKFFGKKVIYDTHEDFSKRILMREWIPFVLRYPVSKIIVILEMIGSNVFEYTIITQDQIKLRMGKKVINIGNHPVLVNKEMALEEIEEPSHSNNTFRLIYAGGISKERGITTLVQSLSEINTVFSCRLWLLGPVPEFYLTELKNLPGWAYVDYLGYVSLAETYLYIKKSDVGIVVIEDIGDHSTSHPNKLFEYMMFGTPFIASNFPKWIETLRSCHAGYFIEPNKSTEIANAVVELKKNATLYSRMKKNGEAFVKKYNWSIESKKLLNLYEEVILK